MLSVNKLIYIIYLFFLCFVFTFTSTLKGYCDNWVYVLKVDEYSLYYNNSDIIINQNDKQIKAWIKIEYTGKGKEGVITRRKQHGLNTSNFHKLSFSLHLLLLDYYNMKDSTLTISDYSTSGELLDSFNFSNPEWRHIVPQSNAYIILNDIMKRNNIQN